ncbi:hypothetical protein P7C70_g7473, partial [Phenoliferia sp. Uapishka_3]
MTATRQSSPSSERRLRDIHSRRHHHRPSRSISRDSPRSRSRSRSPRDAESRSRSNSRSRSRSRSPDKSKTGRRSRKSVGSTREKEKNRRRRDDNPSSKRIHTDHHNSSRRSRQASPPQRSRSEYISTVSRRKGSNTRPSTSRDHIPSSTSGSNLRSSSPPSVPVFRFRFILPTPILIPLLIGNGGSRSRSLKAASGLLRLAFYDSKEFAGPLAELVGSRKSILSGLENIRNFIKEEIMIGMGEKDTRACGDVEMWTGFGEEYLEDLTMSNSEWLKKERARIGEEDEKDRERQSASSAAGNTGRSRLGGRDDFKYIFPSTLPLPIIF